MAKKTTPKKTKKSSARKSAAQKTPKRSAKKTKKAEAPKRAKKCEVRIVDLRPETVQCRPSRRRTQRPHVALGERDVDVDRRVSR